MRTRKSPHHGTGREHWSEGLTASRRQLRSRSPAGATDCLDRTTSNRCQERTIILRRLSGRLRRPAGIRNSRTAGRVGPCFRFAAGLVAVEPHVPATRGEQGPSQMPIAERTLGRRLLEFRSWR
jgi:hypothetical protein